MADVTGFPMVAILRIFGAKQMDGTAEKESFHK
jgi:hypothetical protein